MIYIYVLFIPLVLGMGVMLFQLDAKVTELEAMPKKLCEMEAFILDYVGEATKEIQE